MIEGKRKNANSTEPPLHRAARTGDNDAIRRLVDAGHDPNALFEVFCPRDEDERDMTPLMIAAGSADGATADTVSLLLFLNADPTLTIDDESAATYAATGLNWSEQIGGDADRLQLLLASGSPWPTYPASGSHMLYHAILTGCMMRLEIVQRHIGSRRFRAQLPAHSALAAVSSGNPECIQMVLDAGVSLDPYDQGNSLLCYATTPEAVRFLLLAGYDLEGEDKFGSTPLRTAVHGGDYDWSSVQALIKCGANVNAASKDGVTVFMQAVGGLRHLDTLRVMVDAGADPHATMEGGWTAFHLAVDYSAGSDELEVVRQTLGYLKQLGLDVDQTTNDGWTPLAVAIDCGTGVEVQVLCELRADPNAQSVRHICGAETCQQTELPILFSVIAANMCVEHKTRALLEAGADPLAVDDQGDTPLEWLLDSIETFGAGVGCRAAYLKKLRSFQGPAEPCGADREAYLRQIEPFLRTIVGDGALAKIGGANLRPEMQSCLVTLASHESWIRQVRRSP